MRIAWKDSDFAELLQRIRTRIVADKISDTFIANLSQNARMEERAGIGARAETR
jgi:hypothetical protein